MKATTLILISVLGTHFHASSQKNLTNIAGTVKIGDDISMKTAEVSVQEWIIFIADNNFDSTLFPQIDLLSGPLQLIFLDLKKGQDFDYIKISNQEIEREPRKLKGLRQTKKFHQDSEEDVRRLTIRQPITGITYNQARLYCLWLESGINNNRTEKVKIDLPSDSIYMYVITNRDSLNSKGCALFNFGHCPCVSNTKKDYNEPLGKRLVRADGFFPTASGFYNLQGNVAEMTNIEGKAKGGSFRHYARQSYADQTQSYIGPEEWLGFRYVVSWN